jgi:hypothetical protein
MSVPASVTDSGLKVRVCNPHRAVVHTGQWALDMRESSGVVDLEGIRLVQLAAGQDGSVHKRGSGT